MGIAFLYGSGGGNQLNYRVYSVASELLLPATAKENDIAIVTDAALGDVTIAAASPIGPTEGAVWIKGGTASAVSFNALRNGVLMVYPLLAMQYVGGTWIAKLAKIYKGGIWVTIASTLSVYNYGDENTPATGGWDAYTLSGGYSAPINISKSNDLLQILGDASSAQGGAWVTGNKVDVTPYSTIKARAQNVYTASVYNNVGLIDAVQSPLSSVFSPTVSGKYVGSGVELSVDISNISGSYYIAFWAGNSSASMVSFGAQTQYIMLEA